MCSNAAMKRRLSIWQLLVLCFCLLLQSGWATLSSVQMSLMQQRMAYQQQCHHAYRSGSVMSERCAESLASGAHNRHLSSADTATAPSPAHHDARSDSTYNHHTQNSLAHRHGAKDSPVSDGMPDDGMSSDCGCQCDCQKDCLRAWHSAFSPAFLALRHAPLQQPISAAAMGLSPFQPEVALRPPIALV